MKIEWNNYILNKDSCFNKNIISLLNSTKIKIYLKLDDGEKQLFEEIQSTLTMCSSRMITIIYV